MAEGLITIFAAEDELRTVYRRVVGQPSPPPPSEHFAERDFAQWWTAQQEAIDLLETAEEATNAIEEVRRSAREDGKTDLSRSLSELLYETRTLGACVRRLADTIAWIILRLDRNGTLGLTHGRLPVPITSIDVQEHLNAIELALTQFDEGFGLLSDLTSILQVGDALVAGHLDGEPTRVFLEVKAGEVNAQIDETLRSWDGEEAEVHAEEAGLTDRIRRRFGDSGVEQARRMVRQMNRIKHGIALWHTGEGQATLDNDDAHAIASEGEGWDHFTDQLEAHIDEAAEGNVERFKLDGCLFVEVAHHDAVEADGFSSWLEHEMTEEPIVTGQLVDGLYKPHTRPVFLSDLSEDAIFDVLTGRVSVAFALDLPRFAELMRSNGVPVRYKTGRMADEARQRAPGSSTLTGHRHKSLVVELDEGVIALGELAANRIFFEFVRPSVIPAILTPSIERIASEMQGQS